MSERNRCRRREVRHHLCTGCRERKARFQYRGAVRADRQHVLCFQCFRSARERLRAWQIREGLAGTPEGRLWPETSRLEAAPRSPLNGRNLVSLTASQAEHRRAMLAHLERQAASAR